MNLQYDVRRKSGQWITKKPIDFVLLVKPFSEQLYFFMKSVLIPQIIFS